MLVLFFCHLFLKEFFMKILFVNNIGSGYADHVEVAPPSVTREEIRLGVTLPPDLAGARRLGIAYQVNDGTAEEPQWRDVVSAEQAVSLASGRTAEVRVAQSRGTMEYSRKKMRNVETFTATLDDTPDAP